MEPVMITVGRALQETAARFPRRSALTHTAQGVNLSYAELLEESGKAIRGLMALGIAKGDRVAVFAPNIPEWIVSMVAVMSMGAVLVPVDPGADENLLLHMLARTECRAVIASGESHQSTDKLLSVRERVPSLEHIIVIGEATHPSVMSWQKLGSLGKRLPHGVEAKTATQVLPHDPAAIMFTSGTTDLPKGVLLDHLGLVNKSLCAAERQRIDHRDRLCLFFPLSHMFGNTCIALMSFLKGAHIIIPGKAFDPDEIHTALAREQCTAIYGTPGMFSTLIDRKRFDRSSWKYLEKGIVGGAPCPMDLMKRLVEDLGIRHLAVGYGITEASSWITMTMPEDPLHLRVSTIGRALACSEVRIVNTTTGEPLPAGRRGELCTRGFLMKGYWRMPAATAAAVDPQGWLHTGDLGEMDDAGYVRLSGRVKDVILRSGVEIHPVEVEEVIHEHPAVSQVQVFGFTDTAGDTTVAAWVIPREGIPFTEADIENHVRDRVEENRRPSYYRIVKEFPTTASGKVQKKKLAEMAEALLRYMK
jgi:fatty-acyl-CoA synthase